MPGNAQQSHHQGHALRVTDGVAMLIPIALWFGFVTGLTEVILQAARRVWTGRFSNLGQQVVWMAPLADLLIFGALGAVMYVWARSRRDVRLVRLAITLYAFLASLAVLMLYYPLGPWARLALAGGIAIQFGKIAVDRFSLFSRLVHTMLTWPVVLWRFLMPRQRRHTIGAGASEHQPGRREFLIGTTATLGALAAGVHGPALARELRGVWSLPAMPPSTPNILLVVLDTVRAASLNLFGYQRDTSPQLNRLARRGALFTRAYSHSSWTLPSHASLFTGRYPHELSSTWQTPLDAEYSTIAEVLTAAGYATAGFVGNTNYCSYESGLNRGFLHYEDYAVSIDEIVNSSVLANYVSEMPSVAAQRHFEMLGRKPASLVNQQFLSWLDRGAEHPFFAFLNYFDTHAPYLPPPPFRQQFGVVLDRPNPRHLFQWNWTADQQRAEQAAYDGSLAYLDSEVGHLFSALESLGLLEKTIVIVVSDHGELFGEHGLMDHANSLYAPLLHVPLLMIWPGQIPSDATIRQPVGLRHIAATILDLANVEPGGIRGKSLAPLWRDQSGGSWRAEPILSTLQQGIRVDSHWRNANADLQSLIAGDHHYIRSSKGVEELFDLARDADETMNIADSADLGIHRRMLEQMMRDGSQDLRR
jgi:arylsulfatase A-like enzyme